MCAARRHSGLGPRERAAHLYSSGRPRRRTTTSRRTTGDAPRNAARVFVDAPTRTVVRFARALPIRPWRRRPPVGGGTRASHCDRGRAIRAAMGGRGTRRAREDAAGAEARGAALDEARASVADDLLAALRDAPTPDAAQCAALALASPAARGFLGGGGVRRGRRVIRRIRIHRLLLRVHRRVRDGRHRIDVRARRFRRRGARSVFGARRRRGGVPRGRSRGARRRWRRSRRARIPRATQ